jgi:4-carboxymuconolactone decarboxylase
MTDDTFARGMQIRRDMYGEERADKEWAATTDFNRPMQDLVTRYCFGEIWDRPGLSRKIRSMLTVAMAVALNRPGAVKIHVAGALANGVTKEELREIMLHAAIYCGIPAGVDGTAAAAEVLKAAGLE